VSTATLTQLKIICKRCRCAGTADWQAGLGFVGPCGEFTREALCAGCIEQTERWRRGEHARLSVEDLERHRAVRMSFGRHEGRTLGEVIDRDRAYLDELAGMRIERRDLRAAVVALVEHYGEKAERPYTEGTEAEHRGHREE
jgi:hypothetical protein